MKKLSNVELVLLQILVQEKELSGYEINQLIIERGYREWSGIGTTSIYIGLKKLQKKGLVDSFIDIKKQGKGPLPIKYKVNAKGFKRFKQEIGDILSSLNSKERFEIGLGSMPIFTSEELMKFLNERKKSINETITKVQNKFILIGGENLPINVKSLFKHPMALYEIEAKFIDYLIKNIK